MNQQNKESLHFSFHLFLKEYHFIFLGTCAEYLTEENSREPRMLGLAMIPGRHIISIHVDETLETSVSKIPAPKNSPTSSIMYN